MATAPSDFLRTILETISRNKEAILNAQEEYRLGKITRDTSLSRINRELDQIKATEDILERYMRENRSLIVSNGLTGAFTAAENEAKNTIRTGEQAYRFVRGSKPDKEELGKADQYYAKIKEYSDLFASIQAIVNRAIKLCPTDKKQADALFNNAQAQFNDLLLKIDALMEKVKIPDVDSTLNGIRLSVSQAISDADVARKRCQNSAPVANEPTTANASPTTETAPAAPPATNPSAPPGNSNQGVLLTRAQPVQKDAVKFDLKKDWRVRLSLAPNANYLYKVDLGKAGILNPLQATDGVLFPYTPAISVQYAAKYDPTPLTHTNYTFYNYTGSTVDQISITCDFTAQDTFEANYLLAVIHFFRTATKMFYGQDQEVKPGTPPPLCYLYGYGQFQFSAHPLVISGFTFSLPDDCDYIRAGVGTTGATTTGTTPSVIAETKSAPTTQNTSAARLSQGVASIGRTIGQTLAAGGKLSSTSLEKNVGFNSVVPPGTADPTYVPTKIQLQITCLPIVSRYDVSNTFSLAEYARGDLLRGVQRGTGGMW